MAAATNLNIQDFYCRFLSVDDIWIPLTESLMIERFNRFGMLFLTVLETMIQEVADIKVRCPCGAVSILVGLGQQNCSPVHIFGRGIR